MKYLIENFEYYCMYFCVFQRIPLCKMIRFNTVYTLFTLSEDYPEVIILRLHLRYMAGYFVLNSIKYELRHKNKQ